MDYNEFIMWAMGKALREKLTFETGLNIDKNGNVQRYEAYFSDGTIVYQEPDSKKQRIIKHEQKKGVTG